MGISALFLVILSSLLLHVSSFTPSGRFVSPIREKPREIVGFGRLSHTSCCSSSSAATRQVALTWLKAKPQDDNDDDELPLSAQENSIKDILRQVVLFVSTLWTYTTIFLGVLLSFGLLLNLCGYGYQVTSHGIVIDTIQHFRTERQFQEEILRSMKESRQ